MKNFTALILILFLTLGCATKKPKDKGLMLAEKVIDIWKDITKKQSAGDTSEIEIQRGALPESYKMAVYFIPPDEKNEKWRWERKEKENIISELEKASGKSRVFELINTAGAKAKDMKSMRYMAAQQGAETILLIRGAAQTKSDLNAKALSYLVILPMFFVTGNDVESSFVTQAIVWNVKSPFVHLGLEAEGEWEMERPLFFHQKERAVEKANEAAMQDLVQKLKSEVPKIKT